MKTNKVCSAVRSILLLAVAVVLFLGMSGVTSAQINKGGGGALLGYTLVDLGAGNSGGWSFAYAINNAGQAVGDTTMLNGQNRAFRTQAKQPINFWGSDNLGVLCSGVCGMNDDTRSYAWAINTTGVTVGESVHTINFTQTRAIRSTPGSALDDLQTTSAGNFTNTGGVTNTHAQAINDYGWIVGYYTDNINHTHSLVSFGPGWTQPIDQSWYGSPYASATYGINNNSVMVGWKSQFITTLPRAFMFNAAAGVMRMTDIGMLPGGLTSTAYSINNSAQVVGESQNSTTVHAFFFQDLNNNGVVDVGELVDIDSANSAQSGARSINNHGVAVGYFAGCPGVVYCDSRAAIFSQGMVSDLNSQVHGGTGGWTLRVATGINDNGSIVGFMEDNNPDNQARVRHAFRLDPYIPRLPL